MTGEQMKAIERCWLRGDSISEARLSIRKVVGASLDFETVRATFANIADQFVLNLPKEQKEAKDNGNQPQHCSTAGDLLRL